MLKQYSGSIPRFLDLPVLRSEIFSILFIERPTKIERFYFIDSINGECPLSNRNNLIYFIKFFIDQILLWWIYIDGAQFKALTRSSATLLLRYSPSISDSKENGILAPRGSFRNSGPRKCNRSGTSNNVFRIAAGSNCTSVVTVASIKLLSVSVSTVMSINVPKSGVGALANWLRIRPSGTGVLFGTNS